VPPIVANVVETATKPLRGARQTYEEEEELHFSMKRTRKVTVQSEETGEGPQERAPRATSTVVSERRDAAHELRGAEGPRQLPSAD
jgi:hypothetical protein